MLNGIVLDLDFVNNSRVSCADSEKSSVMRIQSLKARQKELGGDEAQGVDETLIDAYFFNY